MLGAAVVPPNAGVVPPKTNCEGAGLPVSAAELLPKLKEGGAEVAPFVAKGLLNAGCLSPPAAKLNEELAPPAPPNDDVLGCAASC